MYLKNEIFQNLVVHVTEIIRILYIKREAYNYYLLITVSYCKAGHNTVKIQIDNKLTYFCFKQRSLEFFPYFNQGNNMK